MRYADRTLRRIAVFIAVAGGFLALGAPPPADARMRIETNRPLPSYPGATPAQAQALVDGYLDVTIAEFGVRGDGTTDDTDGLRKAFAAAYNNNLVAYLPQRTYRVSGGFNLRQEPWGPQGGSQRKFAHQIVGETKGGRRPVVLVADKSLSGNAVVFEFNWASDVGKRDPSRHYNAVLRGLEIRMGDNPTATAVSMDGAQYCTIENLRISGNFDIGIRDLPGSGGGAVDIQIEGGRIGVRQTGFRPNPMIVGLEAHDQREAGVEMTIARGPLVLVDFDVAAGPASAASHVPVRVLPTKFRDPGAASLLLSNGRLTPRAGGLAVSAADRAVYMENVEIADGGRLSLAGGDPRAKPSALVTRLYNEPIGTSSAVKWSGGAAQRLETAGGESAPPPAARHPDLFSGPTIVGQPEAFVSITRFGATPNYPRDDDAPAFAAAFRAVLTEGTPDFGRTVFVPRGHYAVRSPVVVPDGVHLAGASDTISVIEASRDWAPAVQTAVLQLAGGTKGIFIHDLAVLTSDPTPSRSVEKQALLGFLDVANSAVRWRDVQFARTEFWRDDLVLEAPTYRFRPTAGGYFFGFASDISHRTQAGGRVGPDHRHLLIESRTAPLIFHALNIEHGASRPEIEIRDAAHVRIAGFKFENDLVRGGRFGDPEADGTKPLMAIRRSQGVSVLGGSGNFTLGTDRAMIEITESNGVTLALLDRMPDQRNPHDKGAASEFSFVTVGGVPIDHGEDVGLVVVP